MQTQWRVGFDGPVGLVYESVYRVARTLGVDITPWTLRIVQALEAAELKRIREAD